MAAPFKSVFKLSIFTSYGVHEVLSASSEHNKPHLFVVQQATFDVIARPAKRL
jgi:hypothetical protein